MIICKCNDVTFQEIQKFLKKHPNASFQDLQVSTKASTSCGRCTYTLEKTHEKIVKDLKSSDQLRISF